MRTPLGDYDYGNPPACFSPEAWRMWLDAVRDVPARTSHRGTVSGPPHFCDDCTGKRQAQMTREGRCAYPDRGMPRFLEGDAA